MTSKEKVLELLESNKDSYTSGEAMALSLGLSRNAVWKAINELRKAGYSIDAVSNRGYRLAGGNDIISAAGIIAEMADAPADLLERIHVYDNVDSTNKVAKEMAISGSPNGTLVIAKTQGSGKAHKQNSFQSPEGGIYMSVILTPENLSIENASSITAQVGQKVCDAISSCCAVSPTIQPINNLYVDDKKVCGILTESGQEFDSGLIQWLVIGIGIYFDIDPAILLENVGSLFEPGKATVSKNALIAKIYSELLDWN
ncbi:MAG: biotin--[Pseudobutyrivibrio sp.]|nr:biotin--[acetyl-CoA-carboxylase] ligase [Pseudobutyrivibrio sp.]